MENVSDSESDLVDNVDIGDEIAGALKFDTLGDTEPAANIGNYPVRPASRETWGIWNWANLSKGEVLGDLPDLPVYTFGYPDKTRQPCDAGGGWGGCGVLVRDDAYDVLTFFEYSGIYTDLMLALVDPSGDLLSGDDMPTGSIGLNGITATFSLIDLPVFSHWDPAAGFSGSITSMEVTPIPLPSSVLMFVFAFTPALLWLKRRKRIKPN